MRTIKKSDFSDLVKYLTDDQGKEHRIGDVQITNCASVTLSAAIPEIIATQRQNTRSNRDKTYHLIISFRSGEYPDKRVLQEIEEKVCSGLGFSEHQRVSVTHKDTDNLHIHVAINKIHPEQITILEPFQAYKKLGKLCIELENRYGLEKDNHEQVQTISENRANDMERHSGQESLVSWIRENCLQELKDATSWENFHQVCSEYGLSIKKRGAGLVFQHNDIILKASTVDRCLSKASLEKKLGKFENGKRNKNQKPKKSYQAQPKELDKEYSVIYERYLQYSNRLLQERPIRVKESRAQKSRAYLEVQKKYRIKIRAIKALSCSRVIKKILRRNAYRTFIRSTQSIKEKYQKEQSEIYKDFKKQTWVDWLRQESVAGNNDALKLLQSREKSKTLKGNVIYFENKSNKSSPTPKKFTVDGISKKGSVVYRVGNQAVREQSNRFQLPDDATDFTILSVIDMALKKEGPISLSGSAEFKAKVIKLAAYFNRNIRLKNNQFQTLKNKLEKEINYGRRTRGGNVRRRVSGRSVKSAGQRGLSQRVQRRYGGGREQPTKSTSTRNIITKPNISGIGKAPPPESRNRLRELSELGVVHFTNRSEMLLSGHVSGDMEQQNTQPTDRMRWDFSKSGVTDAHIDAVKRYIKEREQKRGLGIDISKHFLYTGNHKEFTFAGVRNIDQFSMALLKVGEIIEVLPVDDSTVKRLSRIKIGHRITVTNKGLVRIKRGRSR